MNFWDIHHKCAYVYKIEDVVEFTREGMNELKYDSFLVGYPIWNLHVAHVDPMDCNPCKTR